MVGAGDLPVPPNTNAFLTRSNTLMPHRWHVQGICVTSDAIYMSLYDGIYKFDWNGELLRFVSADKHTGDLCYHQGLIYAAVALGEGTERGRIDVYDSDLRLVRQNKFRFPADGITCLDGVLYVGLGPNSDRRNPYLGSRFGKFDAETLKPLCDPFLVDPGYPVCSGVQNITTDGKLLYVSFYTPDEDTPRFSVFDRDFRPLSSHKFGHRQGCEIVGGAPDGVTRFAYAYTVNWLWAGHDKPPPQALINYADLKDGRIVEFPLSGNVRTESLPFTVVKRFEGTATCGVIKSPHHDPFLTREGSLAEGKLRGMCVSADAIYLSQGDFLFKFDWSGRRILKVPAKGPGDLCFSNGKIYTASLSGSLDVYDSNRLGLISSKPCPPDVGITVVNGVVHFGEAKGSCLASDGIVLYAHEGPFDVVAGVSGGAVRFVHPVQLGSDCKGEGAPLQAYFLFSEMKDGVVKDVSRYFPYKKR